MPRTYGQDGDVATPAESSPREGHLDPLPGNGIRQARTTSAATATGIANS
jgi:hypothetical protein